MKPRYRETKIGLIPEEWEIKQIWEIANEIKEKNKENLLVPVLSCTKYDGLVDSLKYFGKQIFSKDTSTYRLVKKHQFAYATNHIEEGSIGYQDLYDCALISPMYTVFSTNQNTIVDKYLFYLLKTERYRQIFQSKTNATVDRRGSLRWNAFSKIHIPLPPLMEQYEIVEILSTVDEAIEKTDAIIEETRQLKKGLMQKLFTEGIGHTRFKDTKIGRIPEEWEIPKLQIICMNVVDCPHTSPKLVEDGYVVVKNFNIRDGRLVLQPKFYTSEEEYYERTSRLKPQAGDVLFSREAPIGEACLVPPDLPLSLGQRMMLFRVNTTLMDKRFLVYSLYARAVRNYMLAISHGVTVKHLNVADVRKLLIPKPSLQEQIQIANILEEIDGKIDNEVAYKEELELLKKGLMQVLLTGKVRVKIADAEEMIHEV